MINPIYSVESVRQIPGIKNRTTNVRRPRTTYIVSLPVASSLSPFTDKVGIFKPIEETPKGYNPISNKVEDFIPPLNVGYISTDVNPASRTKLTVNLEVDMETGEEFPVAENFFDALDNLFGNYLQTPYLGKLFITDVEEKYQNGELKCVQIFGNNTTKNLQGIEKCNEFTATLWLQGQLNGWYYFDKPFNQMASEKLHRAVENYLKFN